MTEIVCFASAKGGVGKTVLAASIGKFIASLGHPVLLVDADIATSGMTLLWLRELAQVKRADEWQSMIGLFERSTAAGSRRVTDHPDGPTVGFATIAPFPVRENLFVLPTSYAVASDDILIDRAPEMADRLRRTIGNLGGSFEYVLIDAEGGVTTEPLTETPMAIADQNVLVSEYDSISAMGIERLRLYARSALKPDTTWVLFNKVLPEFATQLGKFLEVARYLEPVAWDKDVILAFVDRELALNFDKGNLFTLAVARTVERLFRELAPEVDIWRERLAASLREPVSQQLLAAEAEIQYLERRAARTGVRRRLAPALFAQAVTGVIGALLSVFAFTSGQDQVGLLLVAAGLTTVAISGAEWAYLTRLRRPPDSITDLISAAYERRSKLKASLDGDTRVEELIRTRNE